MEHPGAGQATDELEEALKAVLAYRPAVKKWAKNPIKEWAGGESVDGILTLRYPVYQEEIGGFLECLGRFMLLWTPAPGNYLDAVDKCPVPLEDSTKVREYLATANTETVKALLTFVWRGERFCDGFLGRWMEKGLVAALLDRLDELSVQSEFAGVGHSDQNSLNAKP